MLESHRRRVIGRLAVCPPALPADRRSRRLTWPHAPSCHASGRHSRVKAEDFY